MRALQVEHAAPGLHRVLERGPVLVAPPVLELRPQLEHRWRDKHRASLQHAMQPGGGVLDLQRAHPMGRPGHAHTSAPYWRLQHVEPARGFFTTLLGGI